MKDTKVHELATLCKTDDETVALNCAMAGISPGGLLKAVKDGKVTVDQLRGDNGQHITLDEVRQLAGPADDEAGLPDLPGDLESFIELLDEQGDEDDSEEEAA